MQGICEASVRSHTTTSVHPLSKRFDFCIRKCISPSFYSILSSKVHCGSDALVKRTLPSGEEACNANTAGEGQSGRPPLRRSSMDFQCHSLPPTPPHPKYPAPVAPLVPHICSAQARCVQNLYTRKQKMHAYRQTMPICKKRNVLQRCTIVRELCSSVTTSVC